MEGTYQGISGKSYTIDKKLGGGGEGDIYKIVSEDSLVAKVFKEEKRTSLREEKLKLMVQAKLTEMQLSHITWPLDVIYNKDGFAGYIMPKAKAASPLISIYNDQKYDLRYRMLAAVNLCAALDDVHSAGQICGDLNPQNICINLDENDKENGFHITMVDTDSYHFVSGETVYRCEVGLADYLAPEIQKKLSNGRSLQDIPLPTYTKETDLFALAVHIFALLMNGCHPFACAKSIGGQESDIEKMSAGNSRDSIVAPQPIENIKDGFFPFYNKKEGISIPLYAPPFETLPSAIRKLFVRAFVDGYQNPLKRPTAMEWQDTLMSCYKNNALAECAKNHYYFNHVSECPFCQVQKKLTGLLGADNVEIKDESDERGKRGAQIDENKERRKKRRPIVEAAILILKACAGMWIYADYWRDSLEIPGTADIYLVLLLSEVSLLIGGCFLIASQKMGAGYGLICCGVTNAVGIFIIVNTVGGYDITSVSEAAIYDVILIWLGITLCRVASRGNQISKTIKNTWCIPAVVYGLLSGALEFHRALSVAFVGQSVWIAIFLLLGYWNVHPYKKRKGN